MSNQRLLTEYLKRYAGSHKSTTVKVYIAIHAFTSLPDGARPKVDTIADMAGVSRRTANRAIEVLATERLLQVDPRQDEHSRPLPNRYTLLPIPTHKPRSLDVSVLTVSVKDGTGEVHTEEVDREEAPDNKDLGLEIGPHFVRHTTACGGGELADKYSEEVSRWTETTVDHLDHLVDSGPTSGPDSGPGNDLGTSASPRHGRRGLPIVQERVDFKKALPDPDLEQGALDILELLDKLRVQNVGVRPLSNGSRPSQLASARIMVAIDKHPVEEVLDVIRWIFEGDKGVTNVWTEKITKVYALRQHYPQVLEARRHAMVADIGRPIPETGNPVMDGIRSNLAKRLKEHR